MPDPKAKRRVTDTQFRDIQRETFFPDIELVGPPREDLPDVPTPENSAPIQDEAAEEIRQETSRGGRASTLLTGPRGLITTDEDDEPETARRTLLGS